MGELLQIRFQRCKGQPTDNGRCLVPKLLVTRSSQKIMASPSQGKEISLAVFARNGAPVRWEDHCRSIGTLALNESCLMHQHQVISDNIGIRGWIFQDTVALEEEQKVTDYVHVSLHGLTITDVLVSDGLICGFTALM